MKLKILEFLGSKEAKDTIIRVYIATDGKDFYILTDRSDAKIEVGKTYEIINPKDPNRRSPIGNAFLKELYIYKNTEVREAEDLEAPEIERIAMEEYIKPLLAKPYIGTIEGKVVRKISGKSKGIILETSKGEAYVSIHDKHYTEIREGDVVELHGVRAYMELPMVGVIKVLSKAEHKPKEERKEADRIVEGIVLDEVKRPSKSGGNYYIYVLFDGKGIERIYSRDERLSVSTADLIRVYGRAIERGASVIDYEVVRRGKARRISGKVAKIEEISQYFPQYKAELETGEIVFLKEKKEEVDGTFPSNEIDGLIVGIEKNASKRVTVLEVIEEGDKKLLRIHDGEKEDVIEVDKSVEVEEGKDIIIVFDTKGNVSEVKRI